MQKSFHGALEQISKVIYDKRAETEMAMICLLAGGHLLIEDGPGVGKTTLAQTLAKILDLNFSRIQFTSDLLPQDVLGSQIYNEKKHQFEFLPGPIFTQFLLADELNRANPRTQSAFLQAMEEKQVTVEGRVQDLPSPFMVVATQNPSDQAGTFPLPESQLDRFLMSLELRPPRYDVESQILREGDPRSKIKNLEPVISASELAKALEEIGSIKVSEKISNYVVDLLNCGRQKGYHFSTRAGMSLVRAAQAKAWLQESAAITHLEVQSLAPHVLGHRLGKKTLGVARGQQEVKTIVSETPIKV